MSLQFSKSLLIWYQEYKRDLPWRRTQDAYKIWLSEIILQQTRVNQGISYYFSFVDNYPSVTDLASANDDDVFRLWQGLGYYNRCRNLLKTARLVVDIHQGIFPTTYKELLLLPGIGDYTASAVSSFCSNEQQAVLDGNVFRVLSRYFGIEDDIAKPASKLIFKKVALDVLPKQNSAEFNQAIMEFGALQCVPKSPNCNICPLNSSCFAFQQNLVSILPIKTKSKAAIERQIFYLILEDEKGLWMKKRNQEDIWASLYDFLAFDSEEELFHFCVENNIGFPQSYNNEPIKHVLSHQKLFIYFYKLKNNSQFSDNSKIGFWTFSQIEELPKPVIIDKFLKQHYF